MIKPVSVLTAVLTAVSGIGIGAYAANASGEAQQAKESDNAVTEAKAAITEKAADKNLKDETVYVLASADGTAEKIIVSDWLKNSLNSSEIPDVTELSDIVNIKGSEALTDGKWNADGDIYYTGTLQKELPVEMNISYTLDGKTVSPEEIKGKSGIVTVRYSYKNNQRETVKAGGETKEMYVPFAVLTGVILDNDNFRNVEVTNAKLLNDGDRTIIAGYALPGMQENLGIDKEKLEIPDYFEITAEVSGFEMSETVTVITNELFNEAEIDDKTDISGLDSLNELTDAVNQLCDGSDKLYDGLSELLEKSGVLIEGIDKLAEGAEALKNGVSDLADGSAQLKDGTDELAQGLDTLKENSAALSAGSKQVFDALLKTANTQLKAAGLDVPYLTAENYSEVLKGVLNNLDEGNVTAMARQQVEQAVRARESEIRAAVEEAVKAEAMPKVEAAVKESITEQVLSALQLTSEEYEQGVRAGVISVEQQEQINAAVETQMSSDTAGQAIAQNLNAQMQSEEIKGIIAAKTEEQIGLMIEENMKSDEVISKISAAGSGKASIEELLAQLDSYNEFYTGLNAYTAGVDQAAAGADKLKDGAFALNSGADRLNGGTARLYEGIMTLKDSAPALIDGITQLKDGSKELSDGMHKFKEEGVQKIIDAVDGDLKGLLDNLNASKEASEKYNTFSGLHESMNGQVKFIYRTEGIDGE